MTHFTVTYDQNLGNNGNVILQIFSIIKARDLVQTVLEKHWFVTAQTVSVEICLNFFFLNKKFCHWRKFS